MAETEPVMRLYVSGSRAATRRNRAAIYEALGEGYTYQGRPPTDTGFDSATKSFVCVIHDTPLYQSGDYTEAGSDVLCCPVDGCPTRVFVRQT